MSVNCWWIWYYSVEVHRRSGLTACWQSTTRVRDQILWVTDWLLSIIQATKVLGFSKPTGSVFVVQRHAIVYFRHEIPFSTCVKVSMCPQIVNVILASQRFTERWGVGTSLLYKHVGYNNRNYNCNVSCMFNQACTLVEIIDILTIWHAMLSRKCP
jgi:hypothetical protein